MIGENIQRIRYMQDLTLSELAEQAQISKSYLSNIENNINQNPSIQIIEKIANVLAVDFQELIGMKDEAGTIPENEWLEFVKELKESGVKMEELQEYKSIIEFVKWQNKQINQKKQAGD